MIRIKKRERIMISIVLAMIGLIMIVLLKDKQITPLEQEVYDNQSPLSEDKKDQIKQYATQIVEEYSIEGYAMVVVDNEFIAHDQYKRYLLEIQAVAINQQIGNEVYTYYIVLQENSQGDFYVLPFGVEIFKSDTDPLKREIIISMMKVVNGWGDSEEEFEAKWSKVIALAPTAKDKNSYARNELDLQMIYYVQGVLKYMNEYLVAYQKAIENNELQYVEEFLSRVPQFYETEYREMEYFKEGGVEREVLKAELIEIIPLAKRHECKVVIKMNIRNIIENRVIDDISIIAYQIKISDGEFEIIHVIEE